MDLPQAIQSVIDRRDLQAAEMAEVMGLIMRGAATPAQIGGFLIGLRMKGETVEEIAAAAEVMRELSAKVELPDGERTAHLVDTCGTGGDGASTFNISTAGALVTAAAGARVAKHGNRSVSSKSGSADVLEAAGVKIDLNPAQVSQCVAQVGVGFMFAPKHHSAMKHAIGPRKEMGVRTIFNLLGPLTNPAGARKQVVGVFSDTWVLPLAQVLQRLGAEHVLVVHAEDGMDEISVQAPTHVAEFKDGEIRDYVVTPEEFGLTRDPAADLAAADAQASLARIRGVFAGERGAARDIVALNAGAAIYAADLTTSLHDGVQAALAVIDNGTAQRVLDELIRVSHAV